MAIDQLSECPLSPVPQRPDQDLLRGSGGGDVRDRRARRLLSRVQRGQRSVWSRSSCTNWGSPVISSRRRSMPRVAAPRPSKYVTPEHSSRTRLPSSRREVHSDSNKGQSFEVIHPSTRSVVQRLSRLISVSRIIGSHSKFTLGLGVDFLLLSSLFP